MMTSTDDLTANPNEEGCSTDDLTADPNEEGCSTDELIVDLKDAGLLTDEDMIMSRRELWAHVAEVHRFRGFNAAQDAVLNMLQTIDSSEFSSPDELRWHIFKQVEELNNAPK